MEIVRQIQEEIGLARALGLNESTIHRLEVKESNAEKMDNFEV